MVSAFRSKSWVEEEGEIFRKGTVLLGPEEMEGEYAGEDLRREVCPVSFSSPSISPHSYPYLPLFPLTSVPAQSPQLTIFTTPAASRSHGRASTPTRHRRRLWAGRRSPRRGVRRSPYLARSTWYTAPSCGVRRHVVAFEHVVAVAIPNVPDVAEDERGCESVSALEKPDVMMTRGR